MANAQPTENQTKMCMPHEIMSIYIYMYFNFDLKQSNNKKNAQNNFGAWKMLRKKKQHEREM